MKVDEGEVFDAIARYARQNRAEWTIPREATLGWLASHTGVVWEDLLRDMEARYLGEFDTVVALAQQLAEDSYPPPSLDVGLGDDIATVDFQAWPFVHIDWERAAQDLEQSIAAGNIGVVGGRFYFDTSF